MRMAFAAFACHASTDNLLISTSACVFFTFVVAVFVRGAWEQGQNSSAVRRADDGARELA
jgi:hypothetical protein